MPTTLSVPKSAPPPPPISSTSIESSRTSTSINSNTTSSVRDNLTGISSSQNTSQSQSVKVQKDGIIYSPFAAEDSVKQCMGKNITRLRQGKEAYPVIVKDNNAKMQFENIKQQKINQYSSYVERLQTSIQKNNQKILSNNQINFTSNEKIQLREQINKNIENQIIKNQGLLKSNLEILNTYEKLEVYSNQDSHLLGKLSQGKHKLYIVAHGTAGKDTLQATLSKDSPQISSNQLAKDLKKGGLKTSFDDVRSVSCESADTRSITSFNKEELQKASQPTYNFNFSLGFKTFKSIDRQPFAQELSDALGGLGYKNMKVTGYHGSGRGMPEGVNQLRVLDENINSESMRRSLVKQVFTPNT
ncbi:hypothetical protein [uncultured Shewanella sp.]|uniref:hypothetical protein n=1 Tax=uncultured Shewanella sp. TaxID=173975 RepID=UPI002614D232|nr:hypothetical protein [uncultured Shewanella sp.]